MTKDELLIHVERIKKAFRAIADALHKYIRELIKPAIVWFDEIMEEHYDSIRTSLSRAAERITWSMDVPQLRSQVTFRKPAVLRARTNC
ncbi:hypothetical protein ACMG4J_22560 [Rossellomorea marisflavi]|uniref:hypothetical protein n=1 Tax=Rossellomorea marisflavi TaxID=189381 RepID=UPI0039BFD6CB